MMLFMLLATDVEGTAQARAEARPAHLARLEELDKAGRLLTAGPNPMPDNPDIMSGSLIIAEFDNLDAAEEWAGQDPYVQAGVYAEVLIKPYKKVFPK
ncbi:YciI family protein [Kingella kingae]|nr:YciI family protein [Kingella kingae]MBD3613904.1 YciI family protein [Kingella kingae]MBD3632155.1 YciI family protein [Kingella kingae]MBD3659535.1 YciI family protein [Kingella kingae]MDK4528287.1 YciI family protein [Kingella kingae]MDK4534742.1 YciI family protein [Kingella kingae]